ncbi:MAG TPA: hypothetical protein VHG69_14555 [Thermoleophilaceae bacterium]|nr:hypothetical protein [Thermoleophilaceae bacterium]
MSGAVPVADTADAGVARTPDGVLQVIWPRQSGRSGAVIHGSLSRDARRLARPRQIASYDGGLNDSTALVAVPGGVRAFFAGLQAGSPLDRVVATASFFGGGWSEPAPASNPASGRSPFAAAGLGAGARADGTAISVWGSPGPGFHFGLDPQGTDGSFTAGGASDPGVGVDSVTGQSVVAWNVVDTGAVAALPVAPIGPRSIAPGPRVAEAQHRVGVTGRIGASGVYVAYLSGGNQFRARPAVWRFGDPGATVVSRTIGARAVSVAAAPGGRLWVFWQRDGRLYATRSDPAAARFGPLVSLGPPPGARAVHDLAGEGSRGPLDLLALAGRRRTGAGIWHRRVLPRLELAVVRNRRGGLTLRVTDAGLAVAGARIRIAGVAARPGARRRTSLRGTARFRIARGRYRATAAKRGYAPASLPVRVR